MFDFDNFREIWSTIQKNKLRTFLTGFSVAWGIFMLIVLLGAGNGMKNGIMSNFRNFSLNRVETWPRYTSKPYKGMQMNRRIEYKDEDLIAIPRENPEVDLITASISRSDTLSYGDEYNAYSLNGVHPSKAVIDNIEMTVGNGRFINDIDVKEKRKVIVLSPRMKEVLFKGEDPLGKYVNAGSVAYQVIGVYKAEDNDNNAPAYIPFSTAQTLYNAGYGLDEIIFTVKGISTQEEFDAFEKRFRQQMGARHKFDPEDRRAIGMWSTLENFMMLNGMMNGIALFIWVIGIGTLTAGIVGVSNIMLITVRERTREFGIRKAIGATPFSILKLIIVESILITAVFGYLGMILGIGLTEGINSVMEMMYAGKNVSQDDMSMFIFDIDRWVEIWVTITRNKTRSLLTGFGVFWGILMLVILLGSGNGFKNGVLKNVDGFSTNSAFFFSERTGEPYKGYKKGRYWQMRNRDLETIRQRVKGVRYLSPMIMQWGGQNNVVRGQKAGTYNVRGVYSEYFNIETQHILAGRLLNEIDMIEKRKVCLIGNIVREVLFAPDEDPIGQYIRVNGIYYQVVGVIKPKPRAQIGGRTEESVMIPFKTLQQASNQGDKFWFLCATADDGYSCDKMVEDIKTVLRSQNEISPTDEHAISSFTIAKQFETFDMLFTGINILVWLVGIGTLLAGIIGVSNIMMVTVRERTREIGVRRAIGAKPFDIISQIMSESLLLTSLAGLIGLSVGVFLLDVVNNAMASDGDVSNDTFFSNPEIHIGTAVAATVILLFSGLLAGLIPAWRAMQIKAIDAIREE